MKCEGHHKKRKCYAIDPKTGKALKPILPLQHVVQTPTGRVMELKGFVEARYDDKLAKWTPKKMKRTLVPAPLMSFTELHYQMAAVDEAQDAARPHHNPVDRPTTTLKAQPVIIKKGKRDFYSRGQRLPQFTNSKVEDATTQFKKGKFFQTAEVQPREYFLPVDPVTGKHVSRFAEINADDQSVAADKIALSPVPTESSFPALDLESSSDEEVDASLQAQEAELAAEIQSDKADPELREEKTAALATFFSEIRALLSKKR